ncbi:hypothetical protein A1O1_01504 [Capronia coronata CBS 617.96]|uniref:Uncharacterized protein n=1 Tax=Capronia coronata CBS 617.96 TaxID=1182541 RepID=W9YV63_9EURO|nr:uncharacterized protein A1O1_01504 [Capronia coronata CBS 617.96]EXJ96378.1 hypothetical protein A1O1_01504 [Capronia coronata CBS 617.96]
MQAVVEATELTEQRPPTSSPKSEYDPCRNAKITSPFYLYKHDSPRPSFDAEKPFPQVAVHDVEANAVDLSPTITQEKQDAQTRAIGRLKFWDRRAQCMTKPKPRGSGWLAQLPPRQRLLIRILIALVVVGAMVGIAVGISIRVHGGVYKNNNSTTSIG